MEPEKMTAQVMERMLNLAYNDITFKNALVCALDWCNYQHCVNIHKDVKVAVDKDGYIVRSYSRVKDPVNKYTLLTDEETAGKNPSQEGWYVQKKDSQGNVTYVLTTDTYVHSKRKYYEHSYYGSPVSEHWFEKVTREYEYIEVTYDNYDRPKANGWYERVEDGHGNYIYIPTQDEQTMRVVYVSIDNPDPGANPSANSWFEAVVERYEEVNELVNGYLNENDGNFYEDEEYTVLITPNVDDYYRDLSDNKMYYWSGEGYVLYYVNPHGLGWYEMLIDSLGNVVFVLSEDTVWESGKQYYEKLDEGDTPTRTIVTVTVYERTDDTTVESGKTYYEYTTVPTEKSYYRQVTKKVTKYVETLDETVVPDKTYYEYKNADHWVDLPDYTYKYSKNIDLTIPGIDDEITLLNKRPINLEG